MERISYLSAVLVCLLLSSISYAQPPQRPPVDCYISAGDNWWLGESLAVDSPDSVDASFDMLKNVVGVKKIYWRGLEAAAWAHTACQECTFEQNFRYATFHHWMQHLILKVDIEKIVADTAHKKGMELWGVGSIADWGSSADTPTFGDFPFEFESRLRVEHPEWVPVDKYGYRRQGGTIELAYPEARKAMIDLQTDIARKAGYDGVIFLTYAENFSTRFEDEFGYSAPIVEEFKRRYGIDIRREEFNKYASREDWYRLRGEYLTAYLREMKEAMGKYGIKVAMLLEGHDPHMPMVWATLPQMHHTFGHIYFDLETWAQQNIVDGFVVYGNAARTVQAKTINDMLWLTRSTDVKVMGFVTTGIHDENWGQFYAKNIPAVFASWEDQDHFDMGYIPDQQASALKSGTLYEKMQFLAQICNDKSKASAQEIIPLASDKNVLMRRLAIFALGKLKDPAGVETIENGLNDPENGVRCKALQSLQYSNGPQSAAKVLTALERYQNHPFAEGAYKALERMEPFPRDELVKAITTSKDGVVRNTALRALTGRVTQNDLAMLTKSLDDPYRYARYSAAVALGNVRGEESAQILIKATKHADVVVQDRAAISMIPLLQSVGAHDANLHSAMLAAVKNLFLQMGDGCSREDKAYGYRMAGDALLAFGSDGENVLREIMGQDKDKRLAELAWRVLYYREKGGDNEFHIITEQENEAAFQKRPVWLKTLVIDKIVQNFDRFDTASAGTIGVAAETGGRWAGFDGKQVIIDGQNACSKPNSAKLSTKSQLTGWVSKGISPSTDYQTSFWILRDSNESSVQLCIRNDARSRQAGATFSIERSGGIKVLCADQKTWMDAGLTIDPAIWTNITIASNLAKGVYTLSIKPLNKEQLNSEILLPGPADSAISNMEFSCTGGTVHIDDVALVEKR